MPPLSTGQSGDEYRRAPRPACQAPALTPPRSISASPTALAFPPSGAGRNRGNPKPLTPCMTRRRQSADLSQFIQSVAAGPLKS